MAKQNSHGLVDATKEHLLAGNPITRLEALIFFGLSNLTDVISEMRKQGFIVQSQQVPYAKAVARINKHAKLEPPPNLPIREIVLTEYWISK